ncbi:glycosyltransferase [Pseudoalteromonas piscicida]|uniref:Glycosyl transferase family 1 n=1 Tax=Pseudoalteromonas piscicida TaxID=43662 RepID=A0A2A5JM33_PSEO7|nr:glycosyltransferase [Pseudoalteromonas piscicida]PCK30311.1 glycosyl transferase family 1 [Pseudoalteromonas piscicida]
MKVLHIEAGRHLYGGAQQVVYLTQALQRKGVENIIVCPPSSEMIAAIDSQIIVHPVKMAGDLDMMQCLRLRKVIAEHQPDCVHIHSRRGVDTWGLIAAKSLNIPVILSRRVDNPEPRWWSKIKYPTFDKVIAISEGIRQVLLSQGVAPEQVQLVHSAVDTVRFAPNKADRQWLLEEFDLPQNALIVANFAQLIERKGQAVIMRAAKQLVSEHPNLRVLLFGRGPKLQQYQTRIDELGLQKIVQLVGFRQDVARILPAVDIVAHPAATEGLGVALLQSSASGIPVVGFAAGGIPEAIKHSETGLLSQVGDEAQFTSDLNILLHNPSLREEMGKAGRAKMLNKFAIEVMAAGNLSVYRKVLYQLN